MRLPKIVTTLQDYSLPLFRADLVAGITVAMVALPLSLAIAIASGADPAKGLVTAIVGGFFISLLGGSRVQIGGPTGAFIVVVYGVIADHGYDGLVLATFMAGILLLIGGYFRIGRLIRYVPEAVVNGFTIGIAIIIASSQIKDFFGLQITEVPADFLEKLPVLWEARDTASLAASGLALVTLVMIVVLRRMAPAFPGLIVAVSLASLAVVLATLPVETIASRFGALPNTLPVPALPSVTVERVVELFPSAIVIAFLAGVESLLSAMVADRMIEGSHRPNAEMLAQGTANIASALFGGLPATGAIARTATNVRAGGKTPVSGLVHALAILLIMLVAAPLAGYLALPAMAALLVLTAWSMSEPHKWKSYLSAPMADRMLLLTTLILTVLIDLTVAIGVGVSIGLALRLRERKKQPDDWSMPER
ncbi:SulP family inorganic anion transporter [Roseibium aggregatum]|jgi:SulP family sulfate permease|uniref:SulP family inorganic anion transporter n=1 Tax=Stappiaceae TaxID=2821832 RepID=UPI001268014B|nr:MULTISPECIES: SulP family inorganic anion transporter [Stappiaceae]NKI59334.1 SulP family inorganic anion transporter [Labrenzia sp. PO1]QFS96531.1 C4-dicarboxylic acid transporter DauA [Labrenzia sp. THAF191b]QFT02846.1 C4-dicarboxylic acid transporter DauA [Labrenzia sp. THAF191a]QFT14388.1 C4-dicarboxylic acid transporter DauA [Labrenzia sp. THAF187b]UES55901.1 SulP family inorganic anion transporter [Roseibium aggregatum]